MVVLTLLESPLPTKCPGRGRSTGYSPLPERYGTGRVGAAVQGTPRVCRDVAAKLEFGLDLLRRVPTLMGSDAGYELTQGQCCSQGCEDGHDALSDIDRSALSRGGLWRGGCLDGGK
jgi:hypothetical protein